MVLYEAGLTEPLLLTAFSDMDINVAKLGTKPFINLTDKKMMKRFMIACLIILGFAILNYVSLTIAFSRFRNKEMATRRILGTTTGALTFRSFLESSCFTSIAFIIGVALALTVQNKSSALLGKDIEIFSSPAEIIWSMILIILLSIVTALVPAFISSKGKPISIIKGEERYKDICDVVISEMRFGNHTTISEGITAIIVRENNRLPDYIVEVEGDVQEAKRIIKEYLYNIDVRPYFHGYQVHFSPEIKTMDELIEESYHKEKNSITLIGIFALLCMMLTAMAIIALCSYSAQLGTHDAAIHKVFGSSNAKVFWKMVIRFLAPVLVSALAAVPLAYSYINFWLSKYPVKVENTLWIYIVSVIIVITVSIASISIQALRLTRTNPAEAMKKEWMP